MFDNEAFIIDVQNEESIWNTGKCIYFYHLNIIKTLQGRHLGYCRVCLCIPKIIKMQFGLTIIFLRRAKIILNFFIIYNWSQASASIIYLLSMICPRSYAVVDIMID